MSYTFENCTRHHICLSHVLSIEIGFAKSIEIRRKKKEFEERMLKKISSISPHIEEIFTGSLADGFRHGNSDKDSMEVLKDIIIMDSESDYKVVHSQVPNNKMTLTIRMEPQYWEEGYVLLKYTSGGTKTLKAHAQCINYSTLNGFVSSYRFKEFILKNKHTTDPNTDYFMHGPCISFCGVSRDLDIAFSLKCNFWPTQAREWIKRPRRWPSQKLVNKIIQNGCHLVPLGPLKDVKDDLLWRLSFNIAEKKLVFAFNQTQFLCYGLLKIVMKECIQKMDGYPENTLCSYFIKTLMFWMIQDTEAELWQPGNLVNCYMKCLERLSLWINKEECPNFFIPSRNMFKTKVTEETKTPLLNVLEEVVRMGLTNCFARCFNCFSIEVHYDESKLPYDECYSVDRSFFQECRLLSCSFLVNDQCQFDKLEGLSNNCHSELKAEFFVCQRLSMYQKQAIKSVSHEDQIKYLTKAKSLDLTRGPLMLATCLYCAKKYTDVINILEDTKRSLGDFTFYAGINGAEILELDKNLYDYVNSPQNLRYSLREKRKKLLAMDILIHKAKDTFSKEPNWSNIPDEIRFDFLFEGYCLIFHPLVYLYFMDFLCNKHLNEMNNAFDAIRELEYIVSSVCKHDDRPMAHLTLGIVYEEVERFDDALYQYKTTLSFRDTNTSALCRKT